MNIQSLEQSGRDLTRAFALLERANDYTMPQSAALITKRGLLDEARRAIASARAALEA